VGGARGYGWVTPRPGLFLGPSAGEPRLGCARLTSVAHWFWGGAPGWRAALVVAAACLTAVACSPKQPRPGSGVGGISCAAVAHRAWAIRLTAGGRVVWRAPVRGWADRARSREKAPGMPVSPLGAGPVAGGADGGAGGGRGLAGGRVLGRGGGGGGG